MSSMTDDIQKDLQMARKVVIGMDCWSKKTLSASFLAVSVSFYHPSRHQPIHVLLNLHQISHPHTGDMLADKLMETLETWGIARSKILMIVTDNGSNMIKAVRLANNMKNVESENESDTEQDDDDNTGSEDEEDDMGMEESNIELEESVANAANLHRFPCIAHTLQLIIKELVKNQAYTNLITKVRQLVKFIRVSSVAQEKLLTLCGKSVVKDCTTRWNSVFLMIERLLIIRDHLEVVLKDMKHDSLTNSEWGRLADHQRLLCPFKEQTDSLQTDTLSLSSVLPSILELKLHLEDQSLPKGHSSLLSQALCQRFSIFLDPSCQSFDPLPAVACLLDPCVSAVMMRDDMIELAASATSYIKAQARIKSL